MKHKGEGGGVKDNKGGCDVSREGVAGPRPGEGRGNGPKQHAIMSFFFFFFFEITHSITPPGTVYFQTGKCRATRKLQKESLNH